LTWRRGHVLPNSIVTCTLLYLSHRVIVLRGQASLLRANQALRCVAGESIQLRVYATHQGVSGWFAGCALMNAGWLATNAATRRIRG